MLRFALLSFLALASCQRDVGSCDCCPKPLPCRPIDLGICHASPDLAAPPDMTRVRCEDCTSDADCVATLCFVTGKCSAVGKCVYPPDGG